MKTLIVDTGVIYAWFDARDDWHTRAKSLLEGGEFELMVPITTLPEAAHLLEQRFTTGASRELADWLATGQVQLLDLLPQDLRRIGHLIAKYPDLGLVDASLVALAERLLIDTIATTDRRHFATIRPSHTARFTLVP